jgi:hypothetical protein
VKTRPYTEQIERRKTERREIREKQRRKIKVWEQERKWFTVNRQWEDGENRIGVNSGRAVNKQ